MQNRKFLVSLFHLVIFTLLVTAVWAGYYDSITTSSPTFAKDLQTRVWNPFNAKTYAGFTVYVSDYASYPTSAGKRGVRCVYTYENYEYTPPFAWGVYSREHTWCQSWMPVDAEPQHSDYHHLFPLNQNNANGRRSNHPFGKVVNVSYQYLEGKLGTDSSGNTVYEPRDGHKGDAARALFYMAMCYNGINSMDWTFTRLSTYLVSASEAPQSIALLKQWHDQDPPDRWEVERNDWVQGKQSNRNPFVDHPEWVNYINFWNMSKVTPAFATVPTNHLSNFTTGSVGSNSITLTWTDAVAGTQAPSGYMVLAYDTNNYFIPEAGINYSACSDLSNDSGIVYVSYPSSGTYTFNNLKSNTSYYFRVYPYNGSSTTISYKVDGTVPSLQATTITGFSSNGTF